LIDLSSEAVDSRFPLSWSHYARLLAVRNALLFAERDHAVAKYALQGLSNMEQAAEPNGRSRDKF